MSSEIIFEEITGVGLDEFGGAGIFGLLGAGLGSGIGYYASGGDPAATGMGGYVGAAIGDRLDQLGGGGGGGGGGGS